MGLGTWSFKISMNISLKMTGCKNNRYELDKIQEWALRNGIGIADDKDADFSVINTCTVTQIADRKSRKLIRKTKNQNPKLKTIVFGCAARVQKEEFEKINEIDYLLPDMKAVMGFLEKSLNNRTWTIDCPPSDIGKLSHSRAFVQIQDGCDNFCSYCIIATARGKSKSRPSDEIIDEINEYVKNGFNEIVLTGINIGAYGCSVTTKPEESRLPELLEKILRETDVPRIRLSSMGPEYFFNYPITQSPIPNSRLFDILKNPRICRHIHLSAQSGSDSVLKRMWRNYSVAKMDKIIERLKKDIPGIAITADIIVGFPEETDSEFRETADFITRNKFAKVHIFPYSIRKNTLAAKMEQIPEKIKRERANRSQKISDKLRADFIKSQTGKTASVLWELDEEGLTDNYITVKMVKKMAPRSVSSVMLSKDILLTD